VARAQWGQPELLDEEAEGDRERGRERRER
jgi:hypothetical protein